MRADRAEYLSTPGVRLGCFFFPFVSAHAPKSTGSQTHGFPTQAFCGRHPIGPNGSYPTTQLSTSQHVVARVPQRPSLTFPLASKPPPHHEGSLIRYLESEWLPLLGSPATHSSHAHLTGKQELPHLELRPSKPGLRLEARRRRRISGRVHSYGMQSPQGRIVLPSTCRLQTP